MHLAGRPACRGRLWPSRWQAGSRYTGSSALPNSWQVTEIKIGRHPPNEACSSVSKGASMRSGGIPFWQQPSDSCALITLTGQLNFRFG